ncbi:hypothetical protein HPB50_003595 [Hyalomma asiaticum]|uniref:Uncharacterized protein n=1 Tax=Hyalomma asiaticum TaxID=266040 RepID=A0ACB7SSV9_HYAAI|nr:hypothetical protein HPB50_003595 [Hyalomma asiaticum]
MARIAEDDILDDDVQGKDDYELDLADEDALLGLDEDEAHSSGNSRDHGGENVANVQYVDEEGNPVAVRDGDSLEVVDEYSYSEQRWPPSKGRAKYGLRNYGSNFVPSPSRYLSAWRHLYAGR